MHSTRVAWGANVKCRSAVAWSGALLAIALIFTGTAAAQRIQGAKTAPRTAAYEVSREVTLVGAVQKFSENSDALPLGAHVLLQTASGAVDVHLGPGRFLQLNHFAIAEGATLRVIGQMSATNNGSPVLLA